MFSWHRAEGGYRFLLYSAFTFYLLRKVSLALAIFFFLWSWTEAWSHLQSQDTEYSKPLYNKLSRDGRTVREGCWCVWVPLKYEQQVAIWYQPSLIHYLTFETFYNGPLAQPRGLSEGFLPCSVFGHWYRGSLFESEIQPLTVHSALTTLLLEWNDTTSSLHLDYLPST